ncbi:MAG: ABC1 kinase family protein, partial [Oceanidesulfovibrio sp.]
FAEIKAKLEKSLGKPLEKVFSSFNEKPIASASLSQVHKAVLRETGETVAVKIKRPGVEKTIEADLDVMAYLASLAHERVFSLKTANLPDVVVELRKSLTRELDFLNEARNIKYFNQCFADDPKVRAPHIHPRYCTYDVIVLEYLPGLRLDKLQADHKRRHAIAKRGLECAIKQMLEFGFFHADPHLGNLKLGDNDELIFYDFGMVGRFTDEMQSAIVDYIIAVVKSDARRAARVALDMAVRVPPLIDTLRFESDVMHLLQRVTTPIDETPNFGMFLLELTSLCRNYGVYLRPDYILMARALLATESAGQVICPDFDTVAALKPVALRYMVKRYSVLFSDKPMFGDIENNLRLLTTMPERVDKLFRIVESGQFKVEMEQRDFTRMVDRMGSIADRIASGLIVASLIVGSALLFISGLGPKWHGVPILGLIGFILSGVFGAWLLLRMVFSRK